MSRLLDGIR